MSRRLGNLFLLLLSLGFCLVFLEVGVRFWLASRVQTAPPFDRPSFYYAAESSAVIFDYERLPAKPDNTFRIIVIGDSFTFPTFMQFDDAFPKRLERMLNLHDVKKNPLRAEVLSFGKRGLSTEQEIPLLKKALGFSPDLILLQITLNDTSNLDFGSAVKQQPGRYTYGTLQITPETHPILSAWKSLGLIATRWHARQTLPSMVRYYHDIYDRTNWTHFSGALGEFKQLTAQANVRFGAVVFPLFYTVIDDAYPFADLHDRIDAELKARQISFLDLKDQYRGLTPERLQVKPGDDTHPNEIAHRIAADAIYLWLEQGGVIPEALKIVKRPEREEEREVALRGRR